MANLESCFPFHEGDLPDGEIDEIIRRSSIIGYGTTVRYGNQGRIDRINSTPSTDGTYELDENGQPVFVPHEEEIETTDQL